MSLFKIYSSSAGSGKTYTLTKEYLKLILKQSDPKYFKRILAMTFTNDAAREMKNRIIKELRNIIYSENEPENMFKDILAELRLDKTLVQRRADNALHEILQDYDDFAIKTIDSFINRVVSSFSQDLNLPFNYEIVLDTKTLLADAVRSLIDKIGHEDGLVEMFEQFALYKTEENKSWNSIESDINDFAKSIFYDETAQIIDKNSSLSQNNINEIGSKIKKYIYEVEGKVKLLAGKGSNLILENGLTGNEFYQGISKGIPSLFNKLSKSPESLFSDKIPNSNIEKAIYEDLWYSKGKQNDIIDRISGELKILTEQILEIKNSEINKYKTLKAISSNLFLIPFITHIKKEADSILAQNNQEILARFNQMIMDIVSQEPVPYIYERIGEKYNHILVDEFQDTANIQFYNILPLFENTISKKYLNLIVGDPKQAIYSWRGGNVMLMVDLMNKNIERLSENTPEVQHPQLKTVIENSETLNLKSNFRSNREIIDFNNDLFQHIVTQTDSDLIQKVYSSYRQEHSPNTQDGGYIEIRNLEGSNKEKRKNEIEVKLPQLIQDISDDGYSLGDIVILCRQGKESSMVAEILKNAGYSVKSSESLMLKNNLEVKFLISVLELINRPNQTFRKFEFLQFFYKIKQSEISSLNLNHICNLPFYNFIQHFNSFEIKYEDFEAKSAYQLFEYFIQKLQLFENKNATDYLLKLLDITYQFQTTQTQNLSDFLNYWEKEREKLSINAGGSNSITIQTIHKAKGLEYPVVIMPLVNWGSSLKGEIWWDIEGLDYDELKSEENQLKAISLRATTVVDFNQDQLEKMAELSFVENLNLLYVALTRAVNRLYLWTWGIKTSGNNVDSLLNSFIASKYGSIPDITTFGTKTPKPLIDKNQALYLEYKFKTPLTLETDKKTISTFSETDPLINEGNIIHAIFSYIKNKEDIDDAAKKVAREYGVEVTEQIIKKINQIIRHPELTGLFEKDTLVKNESEILSSASGPKRPDRVIFKDDTVYVLDYKTGEERKSYHKQIKEYGRLLKQMGYSKIKLKLIYFDPIKVDDILPD